MKSKVVNEKSVSITRNAIPNTPFEYMSDGKRHVVTLGGVAISPTFDKKNSAYEFVKSITWENLINVVLVCISKFSDYEKVNKKSTLEQS